MADDDAASVIGVIDGATMQCLATLHAFAARITAFESLRAALRRSDA